MTTMTRREWTRDEKLAALMRLPWTIRVETDADGSLIAHVAEMDDATATGARMKDLAIDLWEAIEASLDVRLTHDDPIPLPRGVKLPWLDSAPANPAAPSDFIEQNGFAMRRAATTTLTVAKVA